jgi:ATP-dependent DNA helicase PIF1
MHSLGLSEEQQSALDKFNSGKNVFLTGQGGTGKSFLIKHFLKSSSKNIKVTALTGIAATLLNCKASTIHSWSGIRLAKGPSFNIIEKALRNSRTKKNWRETDVLIIDEVSMMSQKVFEILEKLGKLMRNKKLPFGGLQVVFCGDFFQLPPISDNEDPLSGNYCFESPLWTSVFDKTCHIELKTIFRQKDTSYKFILSQIRIGIIDSPSIEILKSRLFKTPPSEIKLTKLFPILSMVEKENIKQYDIIKTKNYENSFVTETNNTLYIDSGELIPRATIKACETAFSVDTNAIDYEIKALLLNSRCNERVKLKVGAFVMCTVNLNLEQGICNGSQGIIVAINVNENDVPIPRVKFYNGVVMDINVYYWQSEVYPTLSIGQIPLNLAWAMSIHKSQGATLKYAQIDIGNRIFAEGQIYVALSRLESLDGLFLTDFNPKCVKVNNRVVTFYSDFDMIEKIKNLSLE